MRAAVVSFSCSPFLATSAGVLWTVLAQPDAERHVGIRGREMTVRVHAVAEELPADGGGPLHQLRRDRHVVLGPQPSITVAVEDHLAREVGVVRTGGVPEPTVEENSRARLHADGHRAGRI